jgi:hypothetical protein
MYLTDKEQEKEECSNIFEQGVLFKTKLQLLIKNQ